MVLDFPQFPPDFDFGSVCSGIEAASVAFHPLGARPAWLAEIDVAASQVLAARLGATAPLHPLDPDELGLSVDSQRERRNAIKAAVRLEWGDQINNYGDFTVLPAMVRAGMVRAPAMLCGGTPCQAFSVAGRREGLLDTRGQLTLSFVDLADAIDERRAERGEEPCIIYWENVPGVLTDATNAFGCFLAGLVGDDVPVEPGPRPEPGRSSAHWTWSEDAGQHRPKWPDVGIAAGPARTVGWRIGDAQYFGLAQRRRRVVLVGSAREGFDPAAILLEFDGVRRDSPPSREAGQGTTHPVAPCLTSSGRGVERTGDPRGQDPVVACRRPGPDGLAGLEPTWWDGSPVSQTLDRVLYKGQTMPEKNRFPAVLQPVGFANAGHFGALQEVNVGDPLRAKGGDTGHGGETVVLTVALRGRDGGATAELGNERANALRASGGGGDKAYVLAPTLAFSCEDYGADVSVDVAPTMRAMGHAGSHANAGGQLAVCVTGEITHTLRAEGFDASEDGTGRGQPIVVHGTQDPCVSSDVFFALGRNNGGENALFEPTMAVRRLMPVECERLQGFPDNWTLVPVGKKLAADGPRYKQLGNSWAVDHARWVGARIAHWLAFNQRADGTLEFEYDAVLLAWALAA